MRISIDRNRCEGHGRCFSVAPEVFDYDDEGFSVLKQQTIGVELASAAHHGASACPEQAIVIEDD